LALKCDYGLFQRAKLSFTPICPPQENAESDCNHQIKEAENQGGRVRRENLHP